MWSGNVTGGNDLGCAEDVLQLVIKEDVRAQRLQYRPLGADANEMRFVGWRSPIAEGVHHASMGRRVACRYDGNSHSADAGVVHEDLPEDRELSQEFAERTSGHRPFRVLPFVRQESLQALKLEDFIGFSAEYDGVSVECDANFIARILRAGVGSRAEFRRGGAGIYRSPHVRDLVREKQIQFPRGDERAERPAAGEAAGFYSESVLVDGIERPKREVG